MFFKFLRSVFLVFMITTFILLVDNFLLVRALVISNSMYSTIPTGSRVFGLRATNYQYGDIVVFSSPIPHEFSERFIKRIVAVGGEQIQICEEYSLTIPHGYVFVMGDNRHNSRDSREWGAIPVNSIVGRIYWVLPPLTR